MVAMTLLEYKKGIQDPTALFVINEFLESRLFQILPFMNVSGGGYFYNTTKKLPGVGFRGINENFEERPGVLNPESEALKLFGGDIKVDVALIDRYGASRRASEIQAALMAARLEFEKTVFKGDSTQNPREFDGFQRRIANNQLVNNNNAATGAPLSIKSLKQAVDQVKAGTGRKFLFCNDTIARIIEEYYENTASGMLRYQVNELGEEVMMFRGCEVVRIQEDEESNEILAFNEVSPDGTTSTNNTSVYVARFGDNLCTGIQGPSNGVNGIYAEDFGRIEASPHYLTRVNWDCGLVIANGRSVSRLHGVQEASATA